MFYVCIECWENEGAQILRSFLGIYVLNIFMNNIGIVHYPHSIYPCIDVHSIIVSSVCPSTNFMATVSLYNNYCVVHLSDAIINQNLIGDLWNLGIQYMNGSISMFSFNDMSKFSIFLLMSIYHWLPGSNNFNICVIVIIWC